MEADLPRSFTEALISQLGQPHPAHDWSVVAFGVLLVVTVGGAEWLVGEAIRHSIRLGWNWFIAHLKRQQSK